MKMVRQYRRRAAGGIHAVCRRRARPALDGQARALDHPEQVPLIQGMSFPHAAGLLAVMLVLPALAVAQEQGVFGRFVSQIGDRPSGPMAFRFILQPCVAVILAFRDGTRDARTGRSPYFWTVLSNPRERSARLREGLRATGKIIALGFVLDVIYQIMVFGRLFPFEAVLVSLIPFLFYMLLRGPFARLQALRLERQKK